MIKTRKVVGNKTATISRQKTDTMKNQYSWFFMVLLLVAGGLTLTGCSQDNEEEENLEASRPNPNMLSDLSRPGAFISWTLWESHSSFGYTMKIEFDHKECTYTLQKSGSDDTIAKYTYNFNYPTVTLTSNNEDKEVITGTIASYYFKADDITFKNSKNETVWMQMTRKK